MQLENIKVLVSAGDSLLDYPLIKNSTYGIIPSHGELLRNLPGEELGASIYITKESGIFAGQEILDVVHNKFHEIKGTSHV